MNMKLCNEFIILTATWSEESDHIELTNKSHKKMRHDPTLQIKLHDNYFCDLWNLFLNKKAKTNLYVLTNILIYKLAEKPILV
jgi:hypothetical protein